MRQPQTRRPLDPGLELNQTTVGEALRAAAQSIYSPTKEDRRELTRQGKHSDANCDIPERELGKLVTAFTVMAENLPEGTTVQDLRDILQDFHFEVA